MGNSISYKGPGKVAGAGNNGMDGAPGPGPTVRKTSMPAEAYPSRQTASGAKPKGMTSNHKGSK